MSSLMTSISGEQSSTPNESHRNKRRKIESQTPSTSNPNPNPNPNKFRWRTSAEHQSYSTKLLAALRHVRHRTDRRVVRDTADQVLAAVDKGRTHWSRAILTNRVKLRLKNHKKAKTRPIFTPPPPSTAAFTAAPIDKRVKVLSRLVPGCRKVSFSNLLEETTDYIAALQMQVRTMTALAQFLSGSSTFILNVDEPANSNNNTSS